MQFNKINFLSTVDNYVQCHGTVLRALQTITIDHDYNIMLMHTSAVCKLS
jgi:hypothetical protein